MTPRRQAFLLLGIVFILTALLLFIVAYRDGKIFSEHQQRDQSPSHIGIPVLSGLGGGALAEHQVCTALFKGLFTEGREPLRITPSPNTEERASRQCRIRTDCRLGGWLGVDEDR